MARFIIDIPDDKVFAFVGTGRTLLIPYTIAGYKAKHDTGLSLTPYTEPNLHQVRKEAYDRGYYKGYEDTAHNCKETCTLVARARNEGYNEGQKAGERHGMKLAWEAARKILFNPDDGGMSAVDVNEVFGENSWTVMKDFSASEVVAKIKAWEDSKHKFEVGDEIAFHNDDGRPDTVVVVTYIGDDGYVDGMDGKGTLYAHKNPERWTKTGRHFDEIAAVFEKMKKSCPQ